MIEAILTPAHPCSFESLLDEPLARTLNHPTAKGKPELFEPGIIDVIAVLFEIVVEFGKSSTIRLGKLLHLRYSPDISQHSRWLAMAQEVASLAKPCSGLRSGPAKAGLCSFPHILCRMVEGQNPYGVAVKALPVDCPEPGSSITDPDNLFGRAHSLSNRFKEHACTEPVLVSQHGNEPAVFEPGDLLALSTDLLDQTSKDAHLDLEANGLPLGSSAIGSKRSQNSIASHDQRQKEYHPVLDKCSNACSADHRDL